MRLPTPRGPLGALVDATLRGDAGSDALTRDLTLDPRVSDAIASLTDAGGEHHAEDGATASTDPTTLTDRALTLWVLHELHYRGFDEVGDEWEWAPALMGLRRLLEQDLEARLRARFADAEVPQADDVMTSLRELMAAYEGPSLARHVQRTGSREQVLELLRQRSLYHLKEADPTSWVLPRLGTVPKAALMQVQYDEYGDGDPARLHHHLFARGLETSGLSGDYGHYVDEIVTPVLEQNNALSMLGLQRRLRGAALGHLAAFEATSSVPSRQLAQGLARLDFAPEMVGYYDEHVEADAVHEQVVVRDVCGSLVAEEPDQHAEVLLGAWTCLDLEARTATCLLAGWDAA